MANSRTCIITENIGLRIRREPNTTSTVVAVYPPGTTLAYQNVVFGEDFEGNPRWGFSIYGNYFWMGGTDKPKG